MRYFLKAGKTAELGHLHHPCGKRISDPALLLTSIRLRYSHARLQDLRRSSVRCGAMALLSILLTQIASARETTGGYSNL